MKEDRNEREAKELVSRNATVDACISLLLVTTTAEKSERGSKYVNNNIDNKQQQQQTTTRIQMSVLLQSHKSQ